VRFSRPRRCWLLLLLLYIGADFLDPSIPGVFFLDNHALFLDGAVEAKSYQGPAADLRGPAPDPVTMNDVVQSRPSLRLSPSWSMLAGPAAEGRSPLAFQRRLLSSSAAARCTEDH
jgi:hypothetical protein